MILMTFMALIHIEECLIKRHFFRLKEALFSGTGAAAPNGSGYSERK